MFLRLWALEWAWHVRITNCAALKATDSKSEIPVSIFDSFRDIHIVGGFRSIDRY